MSYLSDFLGNGRALQAPAGPGAIRSGDIVEIGANGLLYPVVNADAAAVSAAGIVSALTVPAASFPAGGTAASNRDGMCQDAEGSCYYATAAVTPTSGLLVTKYLSSGVAPPNANVLLDSTAAITLSPQCWMLSNGNILVVWANTGGNINFAIIDKYLRIVVAKTAVDTVDAVTASLYAQPLSGGGFAIAYSKTNPFLAIYSNAGVVVRAGAALTNAAAFGIAVNMKCAQLSNGNIAIAIASSTAAKLLGHSIVTAAGANVVQCTMLDAGTAATLGDVQISSLTGFYCCAFHSTTRQSCYVLSNAGAVQGAAFTDAQATAKLLAKLVSDGTAFWFLYPTATTSIVNIVYIPTAGAGYVTNSLTNIQTNAGDQHNMVYDPVANALIYTQGPTTAGIYGLLIVAGGTLNMVGKVSGYAGPSGTPHSIIYKGDFTVWLAGGNNTGIAAVKFLDSAVLGLSQRTLAAGNQGTLVPIQAGPGNYTTNPIVGSASKAFNHLATTIVGNKGAMLSNGLTMEGL